MEITQIRFRFGKKKATDWVIFHFPEEKTDMIRYDIYLLGFI